ncbi:hypothetical protein LOK49_Contig765G00001 [Camellia lanceoleosa]|nr:hypothetical protein LOK49_Contig765G00001 [Camellia lanceoleosa]
MTILFYGKNGMVEKQKQRKKWKVLKANRKKKDALDSLLRGGGNLYLVRDKPMPEAMVKLWRDMTGLDAKKQTAEVKDVLDLTGCNAAKMKTLNEIITAISIKMNIHVPVSLHFTLGSPSPPPPPPISNRGGGHQGTLDSLFRGGGNLYSVRDKPMPEAMVKLWRGMIGLDAKKKLLK